MSKIRISGDTSGLIDLQAPAVAGSNVLTLPAVTGTLAVDLSSNALTTYLTSIISLNNTATFFDVVNTGAIGASGQKWLISGNCVVRDTAGVANIVLQVTDGTNVFASSTVGTSAANYEFNWSFSFVVTLTGAVTIKIQARDTSATTGQALNSSAVTGATANKATYITAVRLV